MKYFVCCNPSVLENTIYNGKVCNKRKKPIQKLYKKYFTIFFSGNGIDVTIVFIGVLGFFRQVKKLVKKLLKSRFQIVL